MMVGEENDEVKGEDRGEWEEEKRCKGGWRFW